MSTIRQIAVTAIVAALVGAVSAEAGHRYLINSPKQIKPGAIRGKQVKFPRAQPIGTKPASGSSRPVIGKAASAGQSGGFEPLAVLGAYTKVDGASVLQLDWNGAALAASSPCVFQLRLDGEPGSGGQAYVFGLSGVTASGMFEGVPAGTHEVEVYARETQAGNPAGCDLAGEVPQAVNATEVVR